MRPQPCGKACARAGEAALSPPASEPGPSAGSIQEPAASEFRDRGSECVMRSARGSQARKDLPYRSCVGVMLINKDDLVFIGRRRSEADAASDGYSWQMPQGGIDPGEEPYQAALRELYEET